MEGLWQPCVKPVYGCHFSNSICSVGVSVSNLVILPVFPMLSQMIQFAMVIYGQWSLMLLVQKDDNTLKTQMIVFPFKQLFFKLNYIFFLQIKFSHT